ncbi:hypothetical protein MMC30_005652 [Trapelia coarctata]|nr:hypothetical protein [Trapelia coarctata]
MLSEEKVHIAGPWERASKQGLEVAVDERALQLVLNKGGLEPVNQRAGAVPISEVVLHESDKDLEPATLSRSNWYTRGAAGVILLLFIAIAVLGGVLGSRVHSASALPANTSSTSSSPSSVSTVPPTSLPTATSDSVNNRTALGAMAFELDGILQLRVYFQDSMNYVRESAWNASGQSRYLSNSQIGIARSGAPITTTVRWSAPHDPPWINIFTIAESGQIVAWNTSDLFTWNNARLNTQNLQLAPSSHLASKWSSGSLYLIYQSIDNRLMLCNLTGDSWIVSKIPTSPIDGSGISLSSFYQHEYTPQLRLFYQRDSDDLVVADWVSAAQIAGEKILDVGPGWIDHGNSLGSFSPGAPVASLRAGNTGREWAYAYGDVTGAPLVVDVLTPGSMGIMSVPWFVGGISSFTEPTYPRGLINVQNHSPLAADDYALLYAFCNGLITRFVGSTTNGPWQQKETIATS